MWPIEVGVMKGYICQLELATVDPPAPVKVRKLAKVLGLNKADLLLLRMSTKAPSEIRGILKREVVATQRRKELTTVMVTRTS